MKTIKVLVLSIILILSLVNCKQKDNTLRNTIGDMFVENVLEKTHGVVMKKESNDKSYKIMTSVPKYYNNELVILTIAVVCKEYTDVKQLKAWEIKEDLGCISKSYEIGKNHIMSIVYSDGNKLLLFAVADIN